MDKLFDLIKETKENIQNAPSEYPVNLIISGQDAARMHFLVSLYNSDLLNHLVFSNNTFIIRVSRSDAENIIDITYNYYI